MASGGSARKAVSRLLRFVLTRPVAGKQSHLEPAAPTAEASPPDPLPGDADIKPKVWARYLPPLFLLLLTNDELHRWRTTVGMAVAFGIWVFRTFIHLRQGAFILKNSKGLRPLRLWIYMEVAVFVTSSTLLILNAVTFKQQTFEGFVLVITALSMVFVARCERLKIEDEQKAGDHEFQSGTKWLLDCIFDDTLNLRRVEPALHKLRVVTFAVNIISLAAAGIFFPIIPAAEYTAYTWTGNLFHAPAKPAAGRSRKSFGPSPTGSPSPATYDDDCVKTHKGVEPGTGAPPPVNDELNHVAYHGGPGESYTGCFTIASPASPATYYQLGFDEQNGALRSVIIATQGCGTSLIWGDEAAPLRALLDRHISICPDVRRAVGPGDVRLLSASNGTFMLVRPNATTAYVTLSPAGNSGMGGGGEATASVALADTG